LIAYVLLKILHQRNRIAMPLKRVAALTTNFLYNVCEINQIIRPPDKKTPAFPQNQLNLISPGQ